MTEINSLLDLSHGLDWLAEEARPALAHMVNVKEQALIEALQAVQPLWTNEEIARRCVFVRFAGTEREEFFIDGVLAIVFQPREVTQEWRDDKFVMTFTQKYKRVRAV